MKEKKFGLEPEQPEKPEESQEQPAINFSALGVQEVKEVITEKTTINIEKLKEIEEQLKTGEIIKIVDIQAFSKAINGGTMAPVSLKNKIYRLYINGAVNLKPVMRERNLYLVRK